MYININKDYIQNCFICDRYVFYFTFTDSNYLDAVK